MLFQICKISSYSLHKIKTTSIKLLHLSPYIDTDSGDSTAGGSGGLSGGAIAGIVTGCIIGLIIITLVVGVIVYRFRKSRYTMKYVPWPENDNE